MSRVLGVLLLAEGLGAAARVARLLPVLPMYPALIVVMLVLRAIVGAIQSGGGWMLLQRRPAGYPIARTALLLSAALTTAELGGRLAPTSVFPSYRWPLVFVYWAYALGSVWYLFRSEGGVQECPR